MEPTLPLPLQELPSSLLPREPLLLIQPVPNIYVKFHEGIPWLPSD